MDIDKHITKGFDIFVKKTFPNRDIQQFLLKHERRHIVEKNLKREIKEAFHVIHDSEQIEELIASICRMFCSTALSVKMTELNGQKETPKDEELEGVIEVVR